jgi:hypothetical protein
LGRLLRGQARHGESRSTAAAVAEGE